MILNYLRGISHMRAWRKRLLWTLVLGMVWLVRSPCFAQTDIQSIELSPLVAKLINDPALSDAQRRRLCIFHGQWNVLDGHSPVERAEVALLRYDLWAKELNDPSVRHLAAEGALLRGDIESWLPRLDQQDAEMALVRAKAYWQLGQFDLAIEALKPWRNKLALESIDDAAQLVAATQAMVMLAMLEGRPGNEYQLAMKLFGKAHQELDRLYWPAKLAEAELLYEKDNSQEALKALRETLALNPRCGRAWYFIGRMGLDGFNFPQANHAIKQLRNINPQHLLADLLEIHMYLQQRDVDKAESVVQLALNRYPDHFELLALTAAVHAMGFDEERLAKSLGRFDDRAPASPLAHFLVGRYLSQARQYQAGEFHLSAAIKRLAHWATPHIELGLLLMQSGDEKQAVDVLRQAARLDPFHRRVQNQLKLAEEILEYDQIQSKHFIIKYQRGVDEVLARDMPAALERIYDDVTSVFQYQPPRPATIQIMPDKQRLAVRITGMPEIWTVGACTGDVIVITPPREGPRQSGPFDWENVIRHEFVHTVTLNQTQYRVPHWFTEACAVSQERKDRDFATCQLLAKAVADGGLFGLDQINWAFVRPKTELDRPLAYGQSHWMLEYLTETYRHDGVVRMLEHFRQGATNEQAIELVTGRTPQQFMDEFLAWSRQQVKIWGLGPQDHEPQIDALLSSSRTGLASQIDELLSAHPNHPDLLRLQAEILSDTGSYEQARSALLRYAAVRPVDPWSSRVMAVLALRHDRPDDAIGPLEHMDRIEMHSGQWAYELARLHRAAGRQRQSSAASIRSIYREPYNARYRELAAAVAVQRGENKVALHHIYALTLLEPDRPIQWVRLAAMYHHLGNQEKAREAAQKAKALDPEAPVEKYLAGSNDE